MSYIGNQPTAGSYRKLTDISGSFNGSTTSFQLSVPPGTSNYYVTPLSPYQLLISVNSVVLNPGVDFTLNGSQIVFTTAPVGGVTFFGIVMGDAVNIGAPAAGTVTSSALSNDLTIVHNAGSVTTPSITTTGNLNTGVYFPATNNVAVTTNGTQRILFDASGNTNVIGSLRLSGATSGYNGFKAASVAGSTVWTLPTTDGTSNQILKTDGSGNLGWATASGDVLLANNNAFTGANTFTNTTGQTVRNAATQDGIILKGRAGGTSSYSVALQPTTLTASQTLTLPNVTDTFAVLGTVQSFSAAQRGTVSALTDGATITPDFNAANNFSVTLGGSRTLANPTNQTAGQSGIIVITQDATGSRTLAYGSNYKFAGGTAPTLTTTANAVDVLAFYVESATRITCKLLNDVK
jgi:hypothetical protein